MKTHTEEDRVLYRIIKYPVFDNKKVFVRSLGSNEAIMKQAADKITALGKHWWHEDYLIKSSPLLLSLSKAHAGRPADDASAVCCRVLSRAPLGCMRGLFSVVVVNQACRKM